MSSMVRIQQLLSHSPKTDVRESSVLILLYPGAANPESAMIVLMLRSEYGGVHSGQISLPGGKSEPGDKDRAATALREAQEEIGIEPSNVHLLGSLTDLYIPPSNFLVTPILGYQNTAPSFKADPSEVAEIIEIPLAELLNEANVCLRKMKLSVGISLKVPAFCIDGHIIWGATAMILSEFKALFTDASGHPEIVKKSR